MANNDTFEWIPGPTITTPGFDVKDTSKVLLKQLHSYDFLEQKMYTRQNSKLQLKNLYDTQYAEDGVYNYLVDDSNYAEFINQKKIPLPAEISEGADFPRVNLYAKKGEVGTLSTYGISCEFTKDVWTKPQYAGMVAKTVDIIGYSMAWMLDTFMFTTLVENAGAPTINLADGTWDHSNKIDVDIDQIATTFRRQGDNTWPFEVTDLYMDYESYDHAKRFYRSFETNRWVDGYVEGLHLQDLNYLNDLYDSGMVSEDNGAGLWVDGLSKPAILYYRNPKSVINQTGLAYGDDGSYNAVDVLNNPSLVSIYKSIVNDGAYGETIKLEFVMEIGLEVVNPRAVGFMTGFLPPKNRNMVNSPEGAEEDKSNDVTKNIKELEENDLKTTSKKSKK
jgi:hypothetical protein